MKASEIARFLKSDLVGEDIDINGVCSFRNPKENCIAFYMFHEPVTQDGMILLLVNHSTPVRCKSYISVNNPRLAHARVVRQFFVEPENLIPNGDGYLKRINPFPNTTIYDCVDWGSGCYFKPGTVIGSSGFAFEYDENGIPIFRPHTGGVKIGNNVQIGANSVVQRGTIDDTIIGDNVKIDDQVHVGHNCKVGDNTIITAGSVICGTVTIGRNCWIGANCTIIQHISIGDNSKIGIGASVVKNIPPNSVIAGFMAQPLEDLKRFVRIIQEVT